MTESEAIEELKYDCNELGKAIPCDTSWGSSFENAYRMAIQALEKQIAKKPIKSDVQAIRYVNTYYCPVCQLGITGTNIAKWCYHCGQKLDWEEAENNGKTND